MTVVTRFAPSPTGYLHVGGARAALYCWLWAKNQNGKFILRIEDTDLQRSTQEAVDAIINGLDWLGIDYTDGPFYQTKRMAEYKQVIDQLLASNKAYKCFCSQERLDKLREEQRANKQKPKYDGLCRNLTTQQIKDNLAKNHPYVIRFKTPTDGFVEWDDIVKGNIKINNQELDDLIIARTDGSPTYNLTVVVDDWQMQITEVLRGEDHINNTPRQIHILQALGAKIPSYGHMPMILGPDGKKYSKRHGAASVLEFRQEGILPHALLNYLVRLGWSYKDQEIFSIPEMIEKFSLEGINSSASMLDFNKLYWVNQHYLKNDPIEDLVSELKWQFDNLGIDYSIGPDLTQVVTVQRERVKTLKQMAQESKFWFEDQFEVNQEAKAKFVVAAIMPAVKEFTKQLANISKSDWQSEVIKQLFSDILAKYELKFPKLAQPIRIALTGDTKSPSIDLTLELLGKERALSRLEKFILTSD